MQPIRKILFYKTFYFIGNCKANDGVFYVHDAVIEGRIFSITTHISYLAFIPIGELISALLSLSFTACNLADRILEGI